MTAYEAWVRTNVHPPVKGRCAEVTLAMSQAFPELQRVAGFYVCPVTGPRPHWWLVSPDREVIDPTAEQFAPGGEYQALPEEPSGKCYHCGAYVYGTVGHSFCSEACRTEVERLLAPSPAR